MEAHSLEALPATTFSFGREMQNEDQVYGVQLRDFLIDRGYRTSLVPYKFRKQVKHDKYGVFILPTNNQAERQQLPKGWKAFSFTKAVEYVRKAEFQAAILHWQGLDNDGRLPYDQRRFVALTTGERGIEMAILAFGNDSRMVRNHVNSMGDHMADADHEDIHMLSPDISAINQPENRILAYAIDRNNPDTDGDEEEEWGGISPLNVGSPAQKVEEEELYEDSQAGEEEGDAHVGQHHQERSGALEGQDLVYNEEQVEPLAEDDGSDHDSEQPSSEGGSWADDEADSEEDEDGWNSEVRKSQDEGPGAGPESEEEQAETKKEAPVQVDREEVEEEDEEEYEEGVEEEEEYYNGEEYYIDGAEDDNGEDEVYLNNQGDDWYGEEQYLIDQEIDNEGLFRAEEAILEWVEGVEVQYVHPGVPHVRKRSPSPADIRDQRDRSPVRKRMRIRSPSP